MSTHAARPLRRLAAAVAVTSLVALAGTTAIARAAPLSPTSTSAQTSAAAAPAPNDPESPPAAGETTAATPDVTAETLPDNRAVVYVSWDDTTDFTQWRVLAGSDQESLRALATVPRTGSRTAVPVAYTDDDILVRVEALDATGVVVASADRSGLFPIAAAYARAGGAATLGAFVSRSEESGAVTVVYQRGSVQWSAPTGAHPITGRIWDYAKTRRHSLGLPTSDAALLPDGRGTAQRFAAGRVYVNPQGGVYSVLPYFVYVYERLGAERGPLGYPTSDRDQSTTPAHQRFENGMLISDTFNGKSGTPLYGAIYDKWQELGGFQSALGLPQHEERVTPDGVGRYVHFSNGWSVYWTPGTGAHAVDPASRAAWSGSGWELGPLGYPVSDSTPTPDRLGHFVHFEHGSIYTAPAQGGTHIVLGAIRDKWARSGWERGPYGYPASDELPTQDGQARYSHFQYASVYWTPLTGAHEVHGAIRDKWAQLGWDAARIGYPVTDETATPDGRGRYNQFQCGSIYWTPETGPHLVKGAIRDRWASLGWERGPLGYPVTDELTTPDGRGRYTHFQYGSIYWTPQTGAQEVYGSIRNTWAASGWERGPLGYPTSGEYTPAPGQRRSNFERGHILWNARDGRTTTVLR